MPDRTAGQSEGEWVGCLCTMRIGWRCVFFIGDEHGGGRSHGSWPFTWMAYLHGRWWLSRQSYQYRKQVIV